MMEMQTVQSRQRALCQAAERASASAAGSESDTSRIRRGGANSDASGGELAVAVDEDQEAEDEEEEEEEVLVDEGDREDGCESTDEENGGSECTKACSCSTVPNKTTGTSPHLRTDPKQ